MRAIPINSAAATVLGNAAILRNVTLALEKKKEAGWGQGARLMNGAGTAHSWLRGELVILEQHVAGAFGCVFPRPGKI